MTEMHLIKEMEKALGLPLVELAEDRIDPPPSREHRYRTPEIIRGYFINQDDQITGLRLEKLNLEPVNAQLKQFRHITRLNLNDTWLPQWEFLKEWTGLQQLNLYNTKFSDYTWTASLINLETINLGKNRISDQGVCPDRKFEKT